MGGKVVRLTRNIHGDDSHSSEKALDIQNFDWSKFDIIIDNQNMDINQQNMAFWEALNKHNIITPGLQLVFKDGKYYKT
jgi:hypothetical protein